MTQVLQNVEDAVTFLASGGVGVLPTDTIYGLVGSALSADVVERIYDLKKRNLEKPCIVLLGSEEELSHFTISPNQNLKDALNSLWPGPVSIIIPCDSERHEYIHRGKNSIAFRVPEPGWMRKLLKETGPLVAPSANISGKPPAENISEAEDYFGDEVDFYVDAGELRGRPSILLEVKRF